MSPNFNKLYLFDDYVLNAKDKTLWFGDDRVHLPAKAFETLQLLLERNGDVVSKEEMIEKIWEGAFVEENNLSQKISILRRIFGKDKEFIETIPKIGFRFVEPVRLNQNELAERSETAVPPLGDTQKIERPRSSVSLISMGLLVALLVGGVTYFILGSYGRSTATRPSASFDYTELTDTGDITSSAISNDGKFIVFTKLSKGAGEGRTSLRLMDTASKNDIEIEIDGGIQPGFVTFAPDGKSIYFRTRGNLIQYEKIYRISIFGGAPTLIAESVWGTFAVSPDGKELTFVQREISGDRRKIIIQNIESGEKEVVVDSLESPELKPKHVAAFSPDQKLLAFSPLERTNGNATIAIFDRGSKRTRSIQTSLYSISDIVWEPGGDGLYINALEIGKRFQIWNISYPNGELSRVTSDADSYHDLSVAKDGTIVSNRSNLYSNVWIVPGAKLENAVQLTRGEAEIGGLLTTQFIPNGDILYNARFSGGSNIRTMRSNGENGRLFVDKQLVTEHHFAFSKARELIFFEFEDRIWSVRFDGSRAKKVDLGEALQMSKPAVSHDDKWLYYVKREKDRDAIWRMPLDGGEAELLYAAENFSPQSFLSASPDGKYLAFEYEKRGKLGDDRENSRLLRNFGFLNLVTNEIKVMELRASRSILRWRPDGRSFDYLMFSDNSSAIYRKDIEKEAEPVKIFELQNELIYRFDWSPDGKDLLIGRGNSKMDMVSIRSRSEGR